jgi:hypothetical protein
MEREAKAPQAPNPVSIIGRGTVLAKDSLKPKQSAESGLRPYNRSVDRMRDSDAGMLGLLLIRSVFKRVLAELREKAST